MPGSDILSSGVQLANVIQSLVTSQNDYDNALATLSKLIGLPLSDDLLIEDNMSYQKIVVKQAEEEYKITQVKYDEGVGTHLEVMDAQEKLTESQTNFFTTLYNYNVSKA